MRELETWKKQSDEDEAKNDEARLENDRILKRKEFLSREDESKENRKLSGLRKLAARTHHQRPPESPTD
jgi:hypothetical protein